MAYELAYAWKTTPDHYFEKPVSEIIRDYVETADFFQKLKEREG